jgi:WhiB family redox-sensing transcriptional regulator
MILCVAGPMTGLPEFNYPAFNAAARMLTGFGYDVLNPVDAEEFFPNAGEPHHRAVAVCRQCPVRRACLDYALDHNEYGVWGGTSETQRRQIRAKRRNAA